jgi:hypothetical protein
MKETKPKWNWMGSPILANAVEKGVISEIEAEVVIENAVYERSYDCISYELGITKRITKRLYRKAIPKLRLWLWSDVIILTKGKIICD